LSGAIVQLTVGKMLQWRIVAVCLVALLCVASVFSQTTTTNVEANIQTAKLHAQAPAPPRRGNNISDASNAPADSYAAGKGAKVVDLAKQKRLDDLRSENIWKNDLVLWILPDSWREAMPQWTQVRRFEEARITFTQIKLKNNIILNHLYLLLVCRAGSAAGSWPPCCILELVLLGLTTVTIALATASTPQDTSPPCQIWLSK